MAEFAKKIRMVIIELENNNVSLKVHFIYN